jgi:hypothetical protein
MKGITAKVATRDEIDRIVDGLLADPSRVDDVKGALRRGFVAVLPHPVPGQSRPDDASAPARLATAPGDDDDLWENVPA